MMLAMHTNSHLTAAKRGEIRFLLVAFTTEMLALHPPKDYRPGMGFYDTESCLLESDPLPENRVGGFRASPMIHVRRFPAQVVEPYQAAVTFDSSTVSGVGRWLSNDPIGITGGLNQYVFCGNNPVNFRDPFGLCSESDDGYWRRSFRQLWYGNLTADVTLGGTGMQIGTGLLGVDLPGDVRDISADLGGWEWSLGHAGQTTLDVIGLLPVVGALKYVDEGGALAKKAVVEEILKMKRGSIKNAPLPPGSPSWDEVSRMTMEQIEQGARRGDAGYKTIKKLLTDRRFNR